MENSTLRRWLVGISLFLIATGIAVSTEAYAKKELLSLYVSSPGNFSTAQRPYFTVSVKNITQLRVYIYKIRNPIKFFSSMKDPSRVPEDEFAGIPNSIYETATTLMDRMEDAFIKWRRSFFSYEFRKSILNMMHILGIKEKKRKRRKKSPAEIQREKQRYIKQFFSGQSLVSSWKINIGKKDNKWHYKRVFLGTRRKGVYLVKIVAVGKRAYTVIVISDITTISKTDYQKSVFFIADKFSGKPIEGATMYLLKNKKALRTGISNSNGIITYHFKGRKNRTFLIKKGKDYILVKPYAFEYVPYVLYFTTDRPIYKPGDTVCLKGFIKRMYEGGYRTPTNINNTVNVKIVDDEGTEIFKKEYKLDNMGCFNGTLHLPKEILPGYYMVKIKYRGYTFYNYLYVKFYEKPLYRITVNLPQKKVIQGNKIPININVGFYFGKPVVNAKVECRIYESRYSAPWWSKEAYGWIYANYYSAPQKLLSIVKGKTDKKGNFHIQIKTDKKPYNRTYVLQISARDTHGVIANKTATVQVYQSNTIVDIKPERFIFESTEDAKIHLKAVNLNGTPVGTQAEVFLYQYYWLKKGKKWVINRELVLAENQYIDSQKGLTIRYKGLKGGSYLIIVKSISKTGKVSYQGATFYVSEGSLPVRTGGIKLITDKRLYHPNEIAHVYASLPSDARYVFISMDGQKLMGYRVREVLNNSLRIDIPIKKSYITGLSLYVFYVSNGRIHSASVPIRVLHTEEFLSISIKPNKKKYLPGENATFTITVRDYKGRAVEGEFYVSIVDKAIYAISTDFNSIIKTFYGPSYNYISTSYPLGWFYNSFSLLRYLKSMKPKEVIFAQEKGGKGNGFYIRKQFKDTAAWFGAVKTDKNGKIVLHVKMPDDLTAWVIKMEGVGREGLVGEKKSEVITSKDVMVNIPLPPIMYKGDKAIIDVSVSNFTNSKHRFNVEVTSNGFKVKSSGETTINVPAGATTPTHWTINAVKVGKYSITAKATSGELFDGVQRSVDIELPYGKSTALLNGMITKEKRTVPIKFSLKGSLYNHNSVLVSLSSSLFGNIVDGFNYLDTFPYDCNEQVASFLFAILTGGNYLPEVVKKRYWKIRRALNQLEENQLEEGGWGWWQNSEESPYLTAYILHVLHIARQHTEYRKLVRSYVLEEGLSRIKKLIERYSNDLSAKDKAMILFTLSEFEGNKKFLKTAKAIAKSADMLCGSLLAMAINNWKEHTFAKRLLKKIGKTRTFKDTYHELVGKALYGIAILNIEHSNKEALPIINEILQEKKGMGWFSTQDTAWIISLLSTYQKMFGIREKKCRVRLKINGKEILSQYTPHISRTFKNIPLKDTNEIVIEKEEGMPLFYSIRIKYTDNSSIRSINHGISVKRTFYDLIPVELKGNIMYMKSETDKDEIEKGKPLLVVLTIDGNITKGDYIVAEFRLPAGFEPLPMDAYPLITLKEYSGWTTRKWNKIIAFAYVGKKKPLKLAFIVRPTLRGELSVPPTEVYRMYLPEVMGRTDYDRITVK